MQLVLNGQSYNANPDELTNREGMEVERVTGRSFMEWTADLKAGSMLAYTALVYVLRRRDEPDLRFGDVEFTMGELNASMQLDDDEARASLDATEDADERAAMLAQFPADQQARLEEAVDPTVLPAG